MRIRLLHLNIYLAKFVKNINEYVQKNDFDILNFQEVTGGELSFDNIDSFEFLKKSLPNFQGELGKSWNIFEKPESYFGNAIFFKKDFKLNKKRFIRLNKNYDIKNPKNRIIENDPKTLLSLSLDINGNNIEIINTHLAWGKTPKDEPYKLEQGKILYNYLKNIKSPFVLSGDFNLEKDSQVIKWMETFGRNLVSENNIQNTLNPRTHHAQELFPKGLAVDYIFTHPSIKVNQFELIDKIDLSDHLGLLVDFEI